MLDCMNNMPFYHGFGMIFFWILIISLIYFLFSKCRDKANEDTALNILKKRLAKGEISKEEFESLKKSI